MRTATVYNFLIEANIMASLAILLMIPIRKFLRPRLGSRALCFAWLLVAVRLLCPVALPNPWISEIKSPYNFDPTAIRPIAGQVKVRLEDAVDDVWMRAYDPQGSMESIRNDPWLRGLHEIRSGFPDGRSAHFFMGIYLAGVTGVTAWFAVANLLYRRRLKKRRIEPLSGELLETYKALCAEKGVRPLPVYCADPLNSACLAGLIRPWITLPLAADREQAEQMLRHEICHQKARDPFWTLVSPASPPALRNGWITATKRTAPTPSPCSKPGMKTAPARTARRSWSRSCPRCASWIISTAWAESRA